MAINYMSDLDLHGKRVLIREDFNVPLKGGVISSDVRIKAALPTIKLALQQGASVILLSHLGRPSEGQAEEKYSLQPVAQRLSELLNQPVRFETEYLQGLSINPGEIVLCENVRFNIGEKNDDDELGKKLAKLCDVYVMDAFATAHRAQASTHSVAKFADVACAGPLLAKELSALSQSLQQPDTPLLAVVGGSKVSTKLSVLEALSDKVDTLIPGGGIANTFIAAQGFNVGQSLYEPELIDTALALLQKTTIPMPVDVVVATAFSADAEATIKTLADISDDDMILDIGPETSKAYAELIANAGTIIWNGPVGVFEFDNFAMGTESLAKAIAQSDAFSLAGGGDTIAAMDKFNVSEQISYISTGGGAFLEYIEGKSLPALQILQG